VGAGPAGLEAARVAGERGHDVTLLEAAPQAGGQIRLAVQVKRRREIVGIVDWRLAQCERLGVKMTFNSYAEADDIRALSPDIVIIATGGLPTQQTIDEGAELAVSSWDILAGDVRPADEVLLYDDNGQHPGLAAAEFIAEAGSKLELMTPERFFSPDVGGLNMVPYIKIFQKHGVVITPLQRVRKLERRGNKIAATIWSAFREADIAERLVDQVVVENATLPLADLYFALKAESQNRGEVDYDALIAGKPQLLRTNAGGKFQLFRIGDAVASRNIHAAIYDANRLARTL
jgi:NADPH-dependent 2,4-dienoyl-CoA reductase/sulfur reductase-like enzyme